MKRRGRRRKRDWLLIGTVSVAVLAVFLLLYLNWSPDYLQTIKLYYYNRQSRGIMAVSRLSPQNDSRLQATIDLLIAGELTRQEKAAGFETEFPHPDFKLKKVVLQDGVLTLSFTEVPGFTTGGTSRINLLAEQIIKTAKQFPGVKEVKFDPEYLFQP